MYEIGNNYEYYGVTTEYSEETVDLADEYALSFAIESMCYKHMQKFFSENKHVINSNFPYKLSCNRSEYMRLLKQCNEEDRAVFAALCRVVIWNHYAEEFKLPRLPIKVKPKNLTQLSEPFDVFSSDEFWDAIDDHTQKANQHFRNVENTMNTLTKFQDQPVANVKLIHGKPAEDYTEAELVELIRKARADQAAIKDLLETSKRMKAKHESLEKNIAVYVEVLDALDA